MVFINETITEKPEESYKDTCGSNPTFNGIETSDNQ